MKLAFSTRLLMAVVGALLVLHSVGARPAPDTTYWPYWRGPAADGMAVGDAPVTWSDTQNVAWKTDIPGLGHSSPVVWGDRIFLTTAIKTGAGAATEQGEHKFDVLGLDRKTGRILWQRTATTATPHEGSHGTYGSFASNSPVTDGTFVFAFFGSRGMYCYDNRSDLHRDTGDRGRRDLPAKQDAVVLHSLKTLCDNAPVLNAILKDPAARALYLFPTEALAQDHILPHHQRFRSARSRR